nr:PREDICTED: uncharacterized protein LOC109041876 [Bemisia tabaci]XP_018913924.1 PREDICTED: uncharacterized protein LOC109041876 [Bemisia tabaci]
MSEPSNKNGKPTVIGVYGIQGSGKTTIIRHLRHHLDDIFVFFEGSGVIAQILPIEAFKNKDDQEKHVIRCECISRIQKKCETEEKIGIVDGHASFFSKEDKKSFPVYTDKDLEVYTHIIYLCPDISTIFERRKNDLRRNREHLSIECLQQWQTEELTLLRKICRENGILLKAVKSPEPLQEVLALVRDFAEHNEAVNLERAKKMLDAALCDSVETVFVFDGDKTLAPMDASEMFWAETPAGVSPVSEALSISGPTQEYSYHSFRQVCLLYEEAAEDINYEKACRETAKRVNLHPELQELIKRASGQNHVGVIVITAGNRRIWELVLQSQGLAGIQVIAGNRLKDGYVVSKDVKTSLVQHLRKKNLFVVSFGDSPLDMGLLKEANNAIVVVGPEDVRSKKMKFELQKALDDDNGSFSKIGQLLLGTETPLDCSPLPIINLDESLLEIWFCRRVRVIIADEMPAKFLMTPTRDKRFSGKALYNEFSKIGRYLATNHLPNIIKIEKYEIPHVQGNMTDGYRMTEKSTTIIALMRAGLPVAIGVWETMPRAMFHLSWRVADCQDPILRDQSTIIVADAVINSGGTIAKYVKAIREKNRSARIVVFAGVTQEDAVFDKNGRRAYLSMELGHLDVTIVSLRISANKYRGSGHVDTGNRIFNTPHII